jgi:hypothetical protein
MHASLTRGDEKAYEAEASAEELAKARGAPREGACSHRRDRPGSRQVRARSLPGLVDIFVSVLLKTESRPEDYP